MSSRLKLAGICFAAAFALAACGGGGGSTSMAPPPAPPTEPTEPAPPPGPTAESIKADAADAITDAAAAAMAATQAAKDATKYAGMLTAEKVDGESAMAVANAQKILDAEMAANDAVMAADEALQAAMTAKTQAEALSEDDEGRASAITAAERAIEDATAQKKTAMGIVDATGDGTLKAAVAMVKGATPLVDGYPMMPAARGKAVATSVKAALAAAITPVTDLSSTPAPTHATVMNDGMAISAMTWAMIVGESNVMKMRIGEIASGGGITPGNGVLSVASIAGMDASAVDKSGTPVLVSTGTFSDGMGYGIASVTGTPGIEYKGIPGVAICLGGTAGCSVGSDGKLSAGWYFTPASPKDFYVAKVGSYEPATMFAQYGYWLNFDAAGAATSISPFAVLGNSGSAAVTTTLNLIRPTDATADVTAKYSGKAAGISVRGDASGHFTANVNLTATFGAAVGTAAGNSNLRGSISGFEGNAVNSSWHVTLTEGFLTSTAGAAGATAGGGVAGAWTAQGYGPAPVNHDGDDGTTPAVPQRPAGFFGTFNANFGDGAAAGAYATRKME